MHVVGFLLSFGVSLAYLTSHGSAWLSPTSERLHAQWWTGRGLALGAAVLYVGSIAVGRRLRAQSMRQGWWLVLAATGIVLVLVDVWFLGVAP